MLKTFTEGVLFMGIYANLWVLLAMKVAADRGTVPNFAQLPVSPFTCVPFFVLGAAGWLLTVRQRRQLSGSLRAPRSRG